MELKEKIKDFVNIYKVNLIITGGLILLIFLGSFIIYYLFNNANNKDEVVSVVATIEKEKITEEKIDIYYKVDIKGAINKPGVYTLKEESRIIDVINLAGGLKDIADTSVTNLSKHIKDEMVIVIYTKDEVLDFHKVIDEEKNEEKQCVIYNEIIQNDSCKGNILNSENDKENSLDNNDSNKEIDVKISINTADLELLMTVPGIGESKAKNIIDYRENEGLFKTIDDIMKVSGIGEKLFEQIKNYITI